MQNQNENRTVLAISGADRAKFLQDLVTNDVSNLGDDLVYAALLTPQGKYLFDFFLFANADQIFLDIVTDRAAALAARLALYKLRADVTIDQTEIKVTRGVGDMPPLAKIDPRHSTLGWRYYGLDILETTPVDWDAVHVAACVPTTGLELIADSSYILETGFERLNGVDFSKGCYVGQEVTARMKHKTELRKGLAVVSVDGAVSAGTAILKDGRDVGIVHRVAGTNATAYLRFDRAGDGMTAGEAKVTWAKP